MARTIHSRPARIVIDVDTDPITGIAITSEREANYGRRRELDIHKSDTTERRRRINKSDRRHARVLLRKGRFDEVETRQPRGRAIYAAS